MNRSPYLLRSRSQNSSNNFTNHFRSLLETETKAITDLCEAWELKLQTNDNDDEQESDIRATIGQARMLLAPKGRMKQFDQLINDSENNTGEKVIGEGDLEGYWQLLNFQILDVKQKFEGLERPQSANQENLQKPGKIKKVKPNQNVRRNRPQAKSDRPSIRDFIAKQREQAKQGKK